MARPCVVGRMTRWGASSSVGPGDPGADEAVPTPTNASERSVNHAVPSPFGAIQANEPHAARLASGTESGWSAVSTTCTLGSATSELGHPRDQLRAQRVVAVERVLDDDDDVEVGSFDQDVGDPVHQARGIVGLVATSPTGDVWELRVPRRSLPTDDQDRELVGSPLSGRAEDEGGDGLIVLLDVGRGDDRRSGGREVERGAPARRGHRVGVGTHSDRHGQAIDGAVVACGFLDQLVERRWRKAGGGHEPSQGVEIVERGQVAGDIGGLGHLDQCGSDVGAPTSGASARRVCCVVSEPKSAGRPTRASVVIDDRCASRSAGGTSSSSGVHSPGAS